MAPPIATILTKREREIAEAVARGLPQRDITAKLVISPGSAERHVENVLIKGVQQPQPGRVLVLQWPELMNHGVSEQRAVS